MGIMNIIIPLVLFPYDVMFSFDEENEILLSTLSDTGVKFDKEDIEQSFGKCRTSLFEGNQTLIRLPFIPSTPFEFSILSHEIFHATEFIIKRLMRIHLSGKTDEVYAYTIQYLTEAIYEELPQFKNPL